MPAIEIDDRFLDVDFWTEAKLIGKELGCSKPRDFASEPLGAERPLYGDVDRIYTTKELDEIADEKDANNSWLSDLCVFIHDQDGEGSCVAESATAEWELVYASIYGIENAIELSAASLYTRTGSSPGSGSTLYENRVEMSTRGCLLRDTPANKARFPNFRLHPAVGFRKSLPVGWEQDAIYIAHAEYADIEDELAFFSAIANNKPVTYARSSHCITGVRMFGRFRTNDVKAGYQNSWKVTWGGVMNARIPGGMGYDSLSVIRRAASGATCLRTNRVPEILIPK